MTYGKRANPSRSMLRKDEFAAESYPIQVSDANQVGVELAADTGAIRLNVRLTITIQIGGAGGVSEVPPSGGVGEGIEVDEAKRVTDYSDRKGYDPNFLGSDGKRVPLPELAEDMKRDCAINHKAGRKMSEYVLPYHHFSIVMNKVRKIAIAKVFLR